MSQEREENASADIVSSSQSRPVFRNQKDVLEAIYDQNNKVIDLLQNMTEVLRQSQNREPIDELVSQAERGNDRNPMQQWFFQNSFESETYRRRNQSHKNWKSQNSCKMNVFSLYENTQKTSQIPSQPKKTQN